jgi:hypothetical protein
VEIDLGLDGHANRIVCQRDSQLMTGENISTSAVFR